MVFLQIYLCMCMCVCLTIVDYYMLNKSASNGFFTSLTYLTQTLWTTLFLSFQGLLNLV